MIQLLKDIYLVEVPEGAKDFGCVHVFHGEDVLYYPNKSGETIPVANMPCHCDLIEILFTTKDCSELDAQSVVETEGPHFNLYPCFLEPDQLYDSASMSLKSLLRSKGLDPSKNYLLIRKQRP